MFSLCISVTTNDTIKCLCYIFNKGLKFERGEVKYMNYIFSHRIFFFLFSHSKNIILTLCICLFNINIKALWVWVFMTNNYTIFIHINFMDKNVLKYSTHFNEINFKLCSRFIIRNYHLYFISSFIYFEISRYFTKNFTFIFKKLINSIQVIWHTVKWNSIIEFTPKYWYWIICVFIYIILFI